LSVGCGIGLREAEVPTPALLIVDLWFSVARPSLNSQSKVTSRNRRKYSPGIFFSVSASLGRDAVDPHVKIASLRVGTQLNELLQRVAGINAIPYTAVICVIAYL
jgi:hypothetical protein